MPLYDYQCTICNKVKEVQHSISELSEPTDKTLVDILCCNTKMKRTYLSAPSVKTPTRNNYLDRDRKKRNHNNFIKEILPNQDSDTKKHFSKKLGKNFL